MKSLLCKLGIFACFSLSRESMKTSGRRVHRPQRVWICEINFSRILLLSQGAACRESAPTAMGTYTVYSPEFRRECSSAASFAGLLFYTVRPTQLRPRQGQYGTDPHPGNERFSLWPRLHLFRVCYMQPADIHWNNKRLAGVKAVTGRGMLLNGTGTPVWARKWVGTGAVNRDAGPGRDVLRVPLPNHQPVAWGAIFMSLRIH